MNATDVSTDARSQAIRSIRRKRGFKMQVAIYVVINVLLWALWLATGGAEDQGYWPAFVTVAWGLGLAFSAWSTFAEKPISQADIDAEVSRLNGA